MSGSLFENDADLPVEPRAVPSDDWAGLPDEEKPWTPTEHGPPQGPPEKEQDDPPPQRSDS